MGVLFRNGTIITAGETIQADVLAVDGVVTQIGAKLSARGGHEVVNCKGKYLLPGGIDVHTHLDLPFGGTISNDDFESGHIAAAFGGTTAHIDFVIQPIGGSLADGLNVWREKAKKSCIDYGFHMAITDLRDDVMAEIPSMLDEGITSLKLFMAYKNVFMVDDDTLFRAMRVAAEHGMIVMVHAENGDVEALLTPQLLADGKTDPKHHADSRPPEIEGEATNRAVVMAGMTNCRLYVVHMTCQSAVEALARGRALGYPVMGETCTQYFQLTVKDHLAKPGFEGAKYVCSPPIRSTHDHEVLWQAVRNGTLQIVSTDHCDFWYEGGVGPWEEWAKKNNGGNWVEYEAQDPSYRRPGKELGKGNFAKIPNGMPGLEDRMMVGWHLGVNGGRISANRFVELHCTNPAKIFGMYPKKGTIAVGSDADIVVWDPKKRKTISAKTHHMRVDYNCYEGMKVQGVPVKVYLRGEKVVDGDEWTGKKGAGQFIRREPNAAIM